MAASTLEERVAELEAEVKQLMEQRESEKLGEPRGWRRIVGVFKDNPDFEEAVRLGQEWRRQEKPPENEAGA